MTTTEDYLNEMNELYPKLKNLMKKSVATNNPKDAPAIKDLLIRIRLLHQQIIDLHTKEISDIEKVISTVSKYTAPSD
jgi:hypothetical protein